MAGHRSVEQHEEFDLELPQAEAFEAALEAYQRIGNVHNSQKTFFRIEGKVGSGVGNMNLASLTVQVKRVDDVRSRLIVDAAAKEGLINQNTAQKAISRLLENFG